MVDKDGKFTYSEVSFISFDDKQLVSVYPNPTTNYVNISGLTGKTELVVINGAGQQMAKISTSNTTETISLSNYASGSYYLRIAKDGEVVTTEKVVKQ